MRARRTLPARLGLLEAHHVADAAVEKGPGVGQRLALVMRHIDNGELQPLLQRAGVPRPLAHAVGAVVRRVMATVVEIMHAIKDGVIKGMYVMGENPAMSDPDVQHARDALAHLEHEHQVERGQHDAEAATDGLYVIRTSLDAACLDDALMVDLEAQHDAAHRLPLRHPDRLGRIELALIHGDDPRALCDAGVRVVLEDRRSAHRSLGELDRLRDGRPDHLEVVERLEHLGARLDAVRRNER